MHYLNHYPCNATWRGQDTTVSLLHSPTQIDRNRRRKFHLSEY
jgi:hypothetical protein